MMTPWLRETLCGGIIHDGEMERVTRSAYQALRGQRGATSRILAHFFRSFRMTFGIKSSGGKMERRPGGQGQCRASLPSAPALGKRE